MYQIDSKYYQWFIDECLWSKFRSQISSNIDSTLLNQQWIINKSEHFYLLKKRKIKTYLIWNVFINTDLLETLLIKY